MKSKKTKNEIKTNKNTNKNYWKIISLVFIAVIAIIFIIGAFRIYHFKSSSQKTSVEDITLAKNIVSEYFSNKSINYSLENITVRGRKIRTPDTKRIIVEASFNSDNKRESFLIDLESKKIIMHSYTESFVEFPNNRSMPFFNREKFERR